MVFGVGMCSFFLSFTIKIKILITSKETQRADKIHVCLHVDNVSELEQKRGSDAEQNQHEPNGVDERRECVHAKA